MTAYEFYFGCEIGDQDKTWAPHISCNACNTQLLRWLGRKKKKMPFGVPMIWREQADHSTDCYFCLTNIKGFSQKNKTKINYPDCRSAMKLVPHSTEIPIPSPPSTDVLIGSEEDDSSSQSLSLSEASGYEMCTEEEHEFPILINQHMLNDLVRDLGLSKEKAELLSSRLKQ